MNAGKNKQKTQLNKDTHFFAQTMKNLELCTQKISVVKEITEILLRWTQNEQLCTQSSNLTLFK